MSLTLVTGPANSGKAGRVLGGFRARLAEEPVLVVPTRPDVERTRLELAERGALLGGRVVRFDGLFALIAERVGEPDRGAARASELQRALLVEEAVRRARLTELAGPAERPGFARAAERLLRELGRAGVEPDVFAGALRTWARRGPRRAYADDVARLALAYRAALERAGLVDSEHFAWDVLGALRRAPRRFGRTPVFAYGFDDFTEVELAALETLAESVGVPVTVSLPYEAGRPAFRALAPTFERLRARAEHVELATVDRHYAPGSREALHHLERHLFEPADVGPERIAPGRAVRLLAASGERAEVEAVGAEVLGLLRTGTEAGEIGVVLRSPDRLAALVEAVFGAYEIPFALERTVPFGRTPLGRGLLGLVRAALLGGTRDDVLAYLRTRDRGRVDAADALESHLRQEGVEKADRVRLAMGGVPVGALERVRRAGSGPKLLLALERELGELFAAPHAREATLFQGPSAEDPRAFRVARAALADLRALALPGGPRLDARRVHDALEQLPVRLGEEPEPGRVLVATPEAIRARRFDSVFVLGLQEGEFPRRATAEPFLSDDDRRAIAESSGLRLPVREEEIERERYLFYACASRAERQLVLSVRVADEGGAPLAESFFVEEVRDLFTEKLEAERRARTLADVGWTPAEAPTEREWRRAHALEGPRTVEEAPDGLHAEEVIRAVAGRRVLSASALELFADCPVRWFVERLLRPHELAPEPEPLVRGSYAHRVLELTFRRLRDATGSARVTAATLPAAERILVRVLAESAGQFPLAASASRVRAAVRRLEVDLLRLLRREADAGGAFEPEHLELRFGREGDPYGPLRLDEEGVLVAGTIDRVDADGREAVVIDYKSGAKGHPVASWRAEGRLQAALYMLAVRELMGLRPVAGLYQPLRGKDVRPRGLVAADRAEAVGHGLVATDVEDEPEFEAHLRAARETASELAAAMRSGRVRPCPETCGWDGGCAHPAICRLEGG